VQESAEVIPWKCEDSVSYLDELNREYLFVIAIIKDNRELLSDNTSAQCDNLPGRVLHNAISRY